MSFIGKTYKLVKDENFDGFVDSLGLPAERAEALKSLKPVHQLKKDGDTYTLVSNDTEITFKNGVEFIENVGGYKEAKTTVTIDGNNVTQVQNFDDGRSITFNRVYSDNDLVATITTSFWDGVAKRYYSA